MRENPIPSRHRKVPLVMEPRKRRPRDGRYAQRDGAYSQRGRILRFHNRGPPRNLAHSQQTFPNLGCGVATKALAEDRG